MDSIVRIPADVARNGNVRVCLRLMLMPIEICEVNVPPILLLHLHHFMVVGLEGMSLNERFFKE